MPVTTLGPSSPFAPLGPDDGARALDLAPWTGAIDASLVHGRRLRCDSRLVQRGDLFIALADPSAVDAHIEQALLRGASAVLVDAPHGDTSAIVHHVPGLADVAGDIAAEFAGHPSHGVTLVGVTGTNGKTSTVQLLAQAWASLGRPSASIGTLGAGMHGDLKPTGLTTPGAVDFHQHLAAFRETGAACVAVEVSSHALAQGRVAGARFDIVAFTNLTRDHLDFHGSMDAYAATKRRIFELPGVAAAVVNLDDPLVAAMTPPDGVRRVGVSSRGAAGAAVAARELDVGRERLRFTLDIDGESAPVCAPLLGRFNVDNLVMTAGILHAQGVPASRIAGALSQAHPIPGRMHDIPATRQTPRVIVDYAHTPDALGHALAASRPAGGGRLIVVFGCTGDRDRGKRPEMARVVGDRADFAILTDDDVHHEDGDIIVRDTLPGFSDPDAVAVIRQRRTAIRAAIHMARPDDTVVIAGKGHETAQIVGGRAIPSDDVLHAVSALRDRTTSSA